MSKVCVAVDVMGGDEEPQVVLDGIDAALAADAELTVFSVGPEELVVPFAQKRDRVEPLVAPDTIEMGDDPIKAVMSKRKSSIVVACRAVKKGTVQGFFSAGATGAVTAAATAYVTPFKYEDEGEQRPIRPCITTALPNRTGGLTVFCDLGANRDVEPGDMLRFAQMGAAYARVVCDIRTRESVCSPTEPRTPGLAFHQGVLQADEGAAHRFRGNCEGSDLVSGLL